MNKLHLILRLLIEGKSRRYISRTISVSRNTVYKYAVLFVTLPCCLTELYKLTEREFHEIVQPGYKPKTSQLQLQEHFNWAVKKLKKVVIIYKQHLWENYKAEHTNSPEYSQYCHHFKKYLKSQELSYVFDHKAGDKLMIDFA